MKSFSGFSLRLYTEIQFGMDCHKNLCALIQKYGGHKVMLVCDDVVRAIGLYDEVTALLKEADIPFVELSGIQPNPRRTLAHTGVERAKQEGVDFVLGMGGGSTIDTTKAIAFAVRYDGDWWDLYCGKAKPTTRLPMGVVPTIAASGSEMSMASVILDDVSTHKKLSLHSELCRPDFAVLNPEFTYSVPAFQTGAGAADIFAHTFERYFYHDSCALADGFAEGLLKTVVKYGPVAVREPKNYEARAELLLCASFAHNDITGVGHGGRQRGGAHGLESILSAAFDTVHGAGLAVVMPEFLRYMADYSEEACARVARFAIQIFGVTPDLEDLKSVAYEGAARLRAWLDSMGMPARLSQLRGKDGPICAENIPAIVANGRFGPDGIYRNYVTMTKEQMTAFYQRIL
ncbi:iron-containing alcohol dehydrogenase [Intestinimonas massiliensis (ex Afouda et al. 2020)]|uniref:iron-containing alcohol dehydrogenase n=1 Tax=Intestinimonas massiliensis (ex Afouda et al. 2020) TaxID=1673721 RepID=UPI0010320578|nr:iron-containing alcohol dehydrogenase [Intestinimonas massiliensis (ex Afouda et al. 2020)]